MNRQSYPKHILSTRIRTCAAALALAGAVWSLAPASHLQADEKPGSYASATTPALSPVLPFDVDRKALQAYVGKVDPSEEEILKAHRLFDTLAWQAFVALNWPAGENGEPAKGKDMSDNTGWRMWNFWRSSGSIFLPDGAEPAPWDNKLQPAGYRFKAVANLGSCGHTSARDNFEAFTGPLVDQNGNWARFEIRVNQEEFDYIRNNGLYSQDGQVEFSKKLTDNQVELPLDGNGKHGAIEIKLAWKQMGPNDDPSRFYTTDLTVDRSEQEGVEPNPEKIRVGLVGMHISMRTQSSPEWIWSTFEQIDNVRSNPLPGGGMSHPNFNNPANTTAPVNELAPFNAKFGPNGYPVPATGADATTWIESLTKAPTQATRVVVPTQPLLNPLDAKLGAVAAEMNKAFQALLQKENSVFQYYELIDAQWPLHPNAPAFAGGAGSAPESIRYKTPGEMIPVFLVNTTMETFFQKGEQAAGNLEQDDRLDSSVGGNAIIDSTKVFGTESCVGCHYSSGVAIGFKKNPDGSEMVVNGKPVPIYGENNHFGKTGNASFSWMLQLEPQAKKRPVVAAQK